VVDPLLLRQAADRGVTICFADLDGADGLWVPEERTVLVNRGLPESKVAEVIEHELAHVMIDDQHADLDAGKDVLVGHPPVRSRRWLAAGLTAAGLAVVVGGVTLGVTKLTGTKQEQVAPNPNGPGLTAQESGKPAPSTTVVRLPDGRIVTRTVVVTASPAAPSISGTPTGTLAPSPTTTRVLPAQPPRTSVEAPAGQQTTSPAAPPPPATVPPPSPTPEPTTDPPPATTPAGASAGAGDPTGAAGDAGGTDAAGASAVLSEVAVVDSAPGAPVGGPSN
jgi:hypothetical protein